jgi:hypothetical protein
MVLLRPPSCGRGSGSCSRAGTSTARRKSCTCAARSETGRVSLPTRRRSCARCRCMRSRSPSSTSYRRYRNARLCSGPRAAYGCINRVRLEIAAHVGLATGCSARAAARVGFVISVARIRSEILAAGRQVSDRGGSRRRSLVRGRATGPRELNVATITMAAMAALGVRSGSLPFARSPRSRCKREVSANSSERVRTTACICHAEGRGFESHHPL